MEFSLDRFYRTNQRVLIWLILLGLLWLLNDFFALLFLTFVFAFTALSVTRMLQRRIKLPYTVGLIGVYAAFLLALGLFVSLVVPNAIREANRFVGNIGQVQRELAAIKSDFFEHYPAWQRPFAGFLRSYLDDRALQRVDEQLAEQAKRLDIANYHGQHDFDTAQQNPPQDDLVQRYHDLEEQLLLSSLISEQGNRLRAHLPNLVRLLYQAIVTILLALLFSFLILIDLARLQRQVISLQNSRLSDFYAEAAQPVVRFALIVGRALQAQAVIAVVNTLLTATGLWLLAIPSLTMLSLVVFVCSFIPVLGVFISTLPIVLVALSNNGPWLAIAAIGLIIGVHFVEAFLLNPLIYGHRMKLNPVLVLIILFIGHHIFGIWGMVLGVPVTLYVLHDVFGLPPFRQSERSDAQPAVAPPDA
jgi:predicted PurR-regulated permease PerM